MLIAVIDDTGFRIFLLLHILAVIVAFAPAFVWPVASVRLKKAGKQPGPIIGSMAAGNTAQVHGPALVLAGLFGFAMIGMSDKAWKFSQSWVSAALVVWLAMIGLVFGLMLPAEKKAHAGDEAAEKRISMVGGILHLLLLVMLYVMIWKPGVPGVS